MFENVTFASNQGLLARVTVLNSLAIPPNVKYLARNT